MGTPEQTRRGTEERIAHLPDLDDAAADLSPITISDLLSNERRRYALYYLVGCDAAASVEEITEQVAVWETETRADDVPRDHYERVHRAMVHVHLPKLAGEGVVDYDDDNDLVTLNDGFDRLRVEVYLSAEREHREG